MNERNPDFVRFGDRKATVYITEHAIKARMTPFVGFQHAVTLVLDKDSKAWNPDGGWFRGPDTVSYLCNTATGVVRARLGVELFE